jgi:hypothetical protein
VDTTRLRQRLEKAIGSKRLRRIERGSMESVEGFVVGIGARWIVLARTMNGGFFDGFVAVRLRDVTRMRRDTSFESRFAVTRPEWPPSMPDGLALDSVHELVASLPEEVLVGVQQERRRPDMLFIGLRDEITTHWLYLQEVDPKARWSRRRRYRLKRVTSFEWGSHYLRGLAAVAGPGPTTPGRC